MIEVELATLMTNGYLDDDPDSDSYDNFTANAGGLNVSLLLPLAPSWFRQMTFQMCHSAIFCHCLAVWGVNIWCEGKVTRHARKGGGERLRRHFGTNSNLMWFTPRFVHRSEQANVPSCTWPTTLLDSVTRAASCSHVSALFRCFAVTSSEHHSSGKTFQAKISTPPRFVWCCLLLCR